MRDLNTGVPGLRKINYGKGAKEMGKGIKIWAVNDGEKIYKTDLTNPNKDKNSVWDGHKVGLVSGMNETIAFQLIVENGNELANNVKVEVKPFVKSDSQGRKQYLEEKTEVFVEHYLYIPYNRITPVAWFFAEGARPVNKHGWVPDALIPVDLVKDISILPGENQGFWIDIYVPRSGVSAGDYTSEVVVSVAGEICGIIPVELKVLDIVLTDENPSPNMVFVSNLDEYYPGFNGDVLDEFRKMAHSHRFELVGAPEHTMKFDREKLDRFYERYLRDGDNFYTSRNGYQGSGEGVGDRLFPIGMYGMNVFGESDEEYVSEARKWSRWFESLDWKGTAFIYLIDEPREKHYDFIKDRVSLLRRNNINLPIFITTSYKEALDGYVDIWSAGQGTDLVKKAEKEKEGQKFTFYNGYAPRTPMVVLEGDAVDFRVNQWIKMKYDMAFYFYWHGTHWRHNRQGPRGHSYQNVYGYPITFVLVQKQQDEYVFGDAAGKVYYGNGDGTFFYPGRDPHYPEHDLGYNGPISSIRMKNMRRGAQDIAYIDMARKAGFEKEMEDLMNEAVPRAFNEVEKHEKPTWSPEGNVWDGYRLRILELLSGMRLRKN